MANQYDAAEALTFEKGNGCPHIMDRIFERIEAAEAQVNC
jgi:hypothetical protein